MSDSWAREVERFFHDMRAARAKPVTPMQERLNAAVLARWEAYQRRAAFERHLDMLAEGDAYEQELPRS